MDSIKAKMLVYSLVISLMTTLICMGVQKFSGNSSNQLDNLTSSQKLEKLEKVCPVSSDMRKFLDNEKAAQQANEDAADDLPR